MNILIEEGYCYQVLNRLLDVTSATKANMLMKLASNTSVVELDVQEACQRGFEELANWTMPETDFLYLIDDFILVCIPKKGEKTIKC